MPTSIDQISKEDLVRLLIDNTPVAYIILDQDFRIHYINDNFLKLRKLDKQSTMGEICYNISNGGRQCRQCAVRQALDDGQRAFLSRKDILPDGTVRFIDDYAIPLYKNEEDGTQFILEIMVNRTPEMLAREQRDADYDEILAILSALLEAKDNYTATHSSDVRKVAVKLARAMDLSPNELFEISVAASLHDIGKVRIPDAIINKPGKLTDEEFALIKRHPESSYDMLNQLSSFERIRNIVRHHHERVDGRGYPDRLTGDTISLGAKIVAVADTYDAITSTRSYRKALTHDYALEEIERAAGTQLDADVVDVFLSLDFASEDSVGQRQDEATKPVERVLQEQTVKTSLPAVQKQDFRLLVDQNRMLEGIFENTPCGYVLMDTNRTVHFASDYFLSYMGLTKDDVIDKLCYEAGGQGSSPCVPCAIERALLSGRVEYMRQEQNTNNGRKIFDLFGMPLYNADQKVETVIEVIIDRTEEILLERARIQDFGMLIELLGDLLEEQDKETGEVHLSNEIIALRERLGNLLEKALRKGE